jgi:Rrf2 family cysteine metabolism transcriptional repressor
MQLSTKGRYAARAVLELALHYPGEPVRLQEIAHRQEISHRYLEQLMTMLVASGFVRSRRGQHGGFSLARPPEEIRLSDVIQVVEGSLALVDCVDDETLCHRSGICITHDIWVRLKADMTEVLSSYTLADLVKMHYEKNGFSKTQ